MKSKRTFRSKIIVMRIVNVLLCFLLLLEVVRCSDLMRGLIVPEFGVKGGEVTVTCNYDLRNRQLYSLKWYHNSTEFYRYVPTDLKGPVLLRPNTKFQIHELSRGDKSTTLSLSELSITATGGYRCELIAEHPSFRTETSSSYMTILKERLESPIIVWKQQTFSPDDIIRIPCQVRNPSLVDPKPLIEWYLEGSKVSSEYTSPYGEKHPSGGHFGLVLKIPAQQVYEAGGNQKAECRLTLGNFVESETRNIVVERPVVSFSNNFFFSRGCVRASSQFISILVGIQTSAIVFFFYKRI